MNTTETMANDRHSRFKGASWYKYPQDIIIGGAGGIGSWLSLFLARQGHSLHVYDFDTVEEHNIGGQFYGPDNIGHPKATMLADNLRSLGAGSISSYPSRYTKEEGMTSNVMIACFDNMEARKAMFEKWYGESLVAGGFKEDDQAQGFVPPIFIDGRLNAETAEIFCVTDKRSAEKWLADWFPDSKVEDAPCTYKATTHCAAVLAGMMVACLNNHTANTMEEEQRSVPYRTSIWLPSMTVKTEEP